MHDDLGQRKAEHLDLAAREEVEPDETDALFSCVRLVHRALPELKLSDIELSADLCGGRLRAPLMITGMTGGTEEASAINRGLAEVAEEHGIAFGLGSQRAMHRAPGLAYTFEVRAHAPTALVLANLGLVQAGALPTAEVERLVRAVGADALDRPRVVRDRLGVFLLVGVQHAAVVVDPGVVGGDLDRLLGVGCGRILTRCHDERGTDRGGLGRDKPADAARGPHQGYLVPPDLGSERTESPGFEEQFRAGALGGGRAVCGGGVRNGSVTSGRC